MHDDSLCNIFSNNGHVIGFAMYACIGLDLL